MIAIFQHYRVNKLVLKVKETEQLHVAVGEVGSEEVKSGSESILQVPAVQVRLQVRIA